MIEEFRHESLGQVYTHRVLLKNRFHVVQPWFVEQEMSAICDALPIVRERPKLWDYFGCFKSYEDAFAFLMRFG
jgi:hypothetical protein